VDVRKMNKIELKKVEELYNDSSNEKGNINKKQFLSKVNDLDMTKWRELKEKLLLDSLWIIPRRNNKYGSQKFHGNFISEIPEQMILRYTKKGEVVWDCFAGSGTTLDVAKELERECIANDLSPIREDIQQGDTKNFNPGKKVQLVIMHPPYAGIIKFSDKKEDISNVSNGEEFKPLFDACVKNVLKYLEKDRYLCLVIGDYYMKGEYFTLRFDCMNICRDNGLKLKATIIKNMEGNNNSGKDTNVWIYRMIKGGFYKWKHEYIFLFQNDNK
jgi:DNA modification methylase